MLACTDTTRHEHAGHRTGLKGQHQRCVHKRQSKPVSALCIQRRRATAREMRHSNEPVQQQPRRDARPQSHANRIVAHSFLKGIQQRRRARECGGEDGHGCRADAAIRDSKESGTAVTFLRALTAGHHTAAATTACKRGSGRGARRAPRGACTGPANSRSVVGGVHHSAVHRQQQAYVLRSLPQDST